MSVQPATDKPIFDPGSAKTLVDILVSDGIISPPQAKEVKLSEVQTGKTAEEIIKGKKLADETQLTKAKARLYNVSYVDIAKVPISSEALSTLPQDVAQRFKAFPISINPTSKELVVAMADPLDITAIEFIEQKTGYVVKPVAAELSKIDAVLTAGYATSLAKEVSEALREVPDDRGKLRTLDASKTGVIKEERVAEIVTQILAFAVKARASDVHIEPQQDITRVRYRIDGILQEKLTIPKELQSSLVSRIKILSGMKIDEKRLPQDGRFNFKSDESEVDLRVSTLPTSWGEKVVMRILEKTGGIPDLPDLGLRGTALKNLQEAILRPHGIILICGPTGSGKTTTLYSVIQRINTPKVNIITLEDPIEYKLKGVNQVQVNPTAGLTFASGMRSFLRQDPNIILVGEIRDQETTDLAIHAALTGHLVFSTLHTNNAAGALPRLLDLGAEPFLLASSVTAIVGQRVVRKIHDDCKESYSPDEKIIEEVKKNLGSLWPASKYISAKAVFESKKKNKKSISGRESVRLYRGKGDAKCNNTGYYGRVGIFEVLPANEKISRLIIERSSSGEIEKQGREDGMITMKQDGFLKALEGITTIDEVLRVAQE